MKKLWLALLVGALVSAGRVFAEEIAIRGNDTEWHVLSTSLERGNWYQITVVSTVKYGQNEEHKQLHIELAGAASGTYDFAAERGVDVLQESFKIDSKGTTLKVRIKDDYTADNSGTLRISIRRIVSGE